LTDQADIYSFGVVLYELFTGKKPFLADTVEKIFEQILYQQADPQPLLDSGAPAPVVAMIQRCLSKKLIERPASMRDVVEAFTKAAIANPAPAPKLPEVDPGILSPSSQRAESQVRLSMPPPPPEGQMRNATESAPAGGPKTMLWVAGGAIAVAVLFYLIVNLGSR
jgi:serine/threonine protein kinase